MRLLRLLAWTSALLSPMAVPAQAPSQTLHALFAEYWEDTARDLPEWATWRGDHRFDNRLADHSHAARAARDRQARQWLARATAIDRAALSPADQLSLDVFIHGRADEAAYQPFEGWRTMSLGAEGGLHTDLPDLLRLMPADSVPQVEAVLARLAAVPRRVDQELQWIGRGVTLGWVPPAPVLQRVLAQLDEQPHAPPQDSPWLEPLQRMSPQIPPAEQASLRRRGDVVLREQVLPALQRLRDFVAGEYLAAAPASGALSGYPGGAEVYAALVQSRTTTQLTPQQVHEIGLRELARLRIAMEAVMLEMKFDGDFAKFVTHLNTDPRYFHASPEALLAGYRDIAKRIDPELPRLFAELPRAPYGVRAMPAHSDAERAEYYDDPALDGTRPGWFNANPKAFRTRPIWSMETLVAHEAVPGHHLQAARAVELGELPKFRRSAFFAAYAEGWALYAETLGFELGLYKNPESRFGHLQWQAFRAARLVVDTGIHAFGWSRQQAIDYMVERTGMDPGFVATEVDR